jgi:hypothetical protein
MKSVMLHMIAILVYVNSGVAQPSAYVPAKEKAGYHHGNGKQDQPSTAVDDGNEHQNAAKSYETGCSTSNDQGDVEVCIQTRQAAAAEKLNALTSTQIDIANSSLSDGKEALVWTKAQAVGLIASTAIALLAAAASGWAAVIARRGVQSDRAWLTVNKPVIAQTINTVDVTRGIVMPIAFTFHVEWINSGRTAALTFRTTLQYRVLPNDAPIPKFKKLTWDHKEGAVVGPRTITSTPEGGIGDPERQQILAGTHKLVLYAAAGYRDIYQRGKIRESEGCLVLRINGFIQTPEGQEPRVFVEPTGQQNTAT